MVALATLMVVLSVGTLKLSTGAFQFDFKGDLYQAAHAILRGDNPYHPQLIQAEAARLRAGGIVPYVASPRYPPLLMLAVVPLSLLGVGVAGVLFMALSVGAVIGAMWLLGVRDWRCIAVAAVSAPALFGSWIGNVSTLLLFGTAVIWRLRSHEKLLPVTTALVIGAKLFLWPLGAWLLVTRRYRQLALSMVLTVVFVLAAWAVIGFAGLTSYPRMLVNVAYIGELRGSSLVTALLRMGVSTFTARAIALAFTAVLVAAAWRLTRQPDGDERAFGLIVVAALIASPVIWLHSMVLLFVPIALLSPTLSVLWFVPAFSLSSPYVDLALELIVIAAVCAPLVRNPLARSDSRPLRMGGRVARVAAASLLLTGK